MSLTERLAGKGTRQDMEYKEELVHNMPAIAQNAVISVGKKVEDNILHIMIALVVTQQPTTPKNPAHNPLCTLLKAPNAFFVK